MSDYRQQIQETLAAASADEIMARLDRGGLTDEARELAATELRRRGIDPVSEHSAIETAIQETSPARGFWRRLMAGDFGLAKTYWLYLFLPSFGCNVFLKVVGIPTLRMVVLVAYVVYSVPALLGTWRAARRYNGFLLWSVLAAFAVLFGWLSLFLWVFDVVRQ